MTPALTDNDDGTDTGKSYTLLLQREIYIYSSQSLYTTNSKLVLRKLIRSSEMKED